MRQSALVALSALVFAGAPLWAADPPVKSPAANPADDYELYMLFIDTLDKVERDYVKDISRRELMEAAIQGVLNKLDPYSNYIKPDEIDAFRTNVESQFGGIGLRPELIRPRRGAPYQLRIITPLAGTPAHRAGLEAGDVILEIDGKSTGTLTSIDEAVDMMKGEVGTKVTLTVEHARNREREKVTLTREWIHVDTVMGDTHQDDGTWNFIMEGELRIGYIRLTAFSRDTTQDLRKALKELEAAKVEGLILDLRFNPGGLLSTAIEVCDLFVPAGRIVSTKGRNTPERVWDARKGGPFEELPMVVLVNGSSASASEILSACLQDNGRAKVIGQRTWGKGSVQNVIELEGGKSALKLTTASYHRPNGKNIHRFPNQPESEEWGVMPDEGLEVRLSPQQQFQLQEYRRQRDIIPAKKQAPADTTALASTAPAGQDATSTAEPADKPTEDVKAADKPATDQPAADKPAGEPPTRERPSDHPTTVPVEGSPQAPSSAPGPSDMPVRPTVSPGFVDAQLQKAIEQLKGILAQADEK